MNGGHGEVEKLTANPTETVAVTRKALNGLVDGDDDDWRERGRCA